MTLKETRILNILGMLETELRRLNLWGGEEARPNEDAFKSSTPFCLDTMEFHQWVEYVLIARCRYLIENELPLPQNILVHTMAQEYYRGKWAEYKNFITLLKTLDDTFK